MISPQRQTGSSGSTAMPRPPRARLELAAAVQDETVAIAEARRAMAAFERLDARRDADRPPRCSGRWRASRAGATRRGHADEAGTRGVRAPRRGTDEPGDRGAALHLDEDRGAPREQRARQARAQEPAGGGGPRDQGRGPRPGREIGNLPDVRGRGHGHDRRVHARKEASDGRTGTGIGSPNALKRPIEVAVEVQSAAPPEAVYDLLTDPASHLIWAGSGRGRRCVCSRSTPHPRRSVSATSS